MLIVELYTNSQNIFLRGISFQQPRVLQSGEAACAEEITQYPIVEEEPAYVRYGTRYTHTHTERERERGTKRYISIIKECATVTNEQPTFTKGYKVTLYSDSLRATAL